MLSPHVHPSSPADGSFRIAAHRAPPAAAPAEHRVFLAADDPQAAEAWARALVAEGLEVERCASPGALEPAGRAGVLAWVLHVGAALAPRLAELRTRREQAPHLPLVVVVRGLRDLDHVLALEMGADDVLDAALAAPVVAARLRALGRRAGVGAAAATHWPTDRELPRELRFGALRLSLLAREVHLADAPVPLTEGEFEVLWLLASHAGQALSRREILKRVRGLDDQPLDRSIDSRVYRIRAKLGDSRMNPSRIRTVRHQGYAFSPSDW